MTRKPKEKIGSRQGKAYGKVKGQYNQPTVRKRIEALFLDNIGKVMTREMIIKAATDPTTGKQPENWHQRLSELRTDSGYTIPVLARRRKLGSRRVSDADQGEETDCRQAR